MKRKSEWPEYDGQRDGNRFQWIKEQSEAIREQRQIVAITRQRFTALEKSAQAEADYEIDTEDARRLKMLRSKYNPARHRATKKGA